MKVLMIDNYDSFTYNLVQYLGELGAEVEVVRNDQIGVNDILGSDASHIMVSPGPCTPNEAGISMAAIEALGGIKPILGVCLGHQSIGQVFGGRIIHANQIMHGKTSMVKHTGVGVFSGLADPFEATRYHSLVIDKQSLPDCLELTAWTVNDEHTRCQVVVDHQLIAQHQQDIRCLVFVWIRAIGQLWLDIADRIITKVTDQAAVEFGQALGLGNLEKIQVVFDKLERIVGFFLADDLAINLKYGSTTEYLQTLATGQAYDRVATPFFTPLYRFKQVSVSLVGQFQVGTERCVQIGEYFTYQRDAVIFALYLIELLKIHGKYSKRVNKGTTKQRCGITIASKYCLPCYV